MAAYLRIYDSQEPGSVIEYGLPLPLYEMPFNVQSKADMNQLNPPHRANNYKVEKQKK